MPPRDYASGVQERLRVARSRLGGAELGRQQAEALWKRAVKASEDAATGVSVDTCLKAHKLWLQAEAETARLADILRGLDDAVTDAIQFGDRLHFHQTGFRKQYAGMGYQYEVLVEGAARAAALAEQAALGTSAREQREAAREVRDSVAALQRYTEATKQSVLKKHIDDRVSRVIVVFESVFRDQAPGLWEDALLRLKSAEEQERTG